MLYIIKDEISYEVFYLDPESNLPNQADETASKADHSAKRPDNNQSD